MARGWLGLSAVFFLAALATGACEAPRSELVGTGAGGTGSSGNTQGGGGQLFAVGGMDTGPTCENLECKQVACSGGKTTTVSGTVYDPSGKLPLYNVLVYVPNAPLDPIPEGASCDKCGFVSGDPVVSAITDTKGQFLLENVPVGAQIPLVVQVGKWRREIVIPVNECEPNPIVDVELTSLPSKQSEGHIPRLALTTGGADPLECLLRKIGLEPEEFTLSSGTGRVNLYAGPGGADQYAGNMNGGAAIEQAEPFWSSLDALKAYDIVLMACEGGQNENTKPPVALQAMHDYADIGGRIFASHWHNYWIQSGPAPWPTMAEWDFQSDPSSPYTGVVEQGFPKGLALAEWLVNVGASQTPGELEINQPQHTLNGVNALLAQQWIYGKAQDPGSVKYFTFNAPAGAEEDKLCGRVVFSDIHVSSGDDPGDNFPNGCTTTDLSPQEKALVFMLFDLSSCIQPDEEPPVPPPT